MDYRVYEKAVNIGTQFLFPLYTYGMATESLMKVYIAICDGNIKLL